MKKTALVLISFAALSSCQGNSNGEPVDYGPEVSNKDLNKALAAPLESLDPLSLKVGQFVHFSTIEELAGAQQVEVLADTGQTIVDQTETDTTVGFDIIQNKFTYLKNPPEKSTVEYALNFAKATPDDPSAASVSSHKPDLRSLRAKLGREWPTTLKNKMRRVTTLDTDTSGDATTTVTIHKLVTSDSIEAPPGDAAQQPNCLGIPQCQIHVHHVSFDQVTWTDGKGEKVHFELAMSPDVPLLSGYRMTPLFEYYPGLVKSCVSLMVAVGDAGSKILLTECNQLENFRFQADPQPLQ